MVNAGDKALERIIAELTTAVAFSGDPRLFRLLRLAIEERSPEQVERMERAQGLTTVARRAQNYK